MASYQPGDTVRLETTFAVGETLTDPDAVTLSYRSPAGVSTSLTYLTDVALVKDATGTFHADVEVATPGLWTWTWEGTGAAAGVDEGDFTVERTLSSSPRLCSVDDVRAFLQKPGGDVEQDDVISVLITRASRAIMNFTSREFVVDGVNPQTRTFDIGDFGRVRAGAGIPIAELQAPPTAAAVLDAYGTTVTTLDVDDDLVYLPMNRPSWQPITHLRFRPGVACPSTTAVLSVTGSWGWPQVPEDVAQACIVTVGIWMRRDIQAFTATFNLDEGRLERPQALPSAAMSLLRRYQRWVMA